MIPIKIPPQPDWDIEQNIPVLPTRREINHIEILQLESDLEEEEQLEDILDPSQHLSREPEYSKGI